MRGFGRLWAAFAMGLFISLAIGCLGGNLPGLSIPSPLQPGTYAGSATTSMLVVERVTGSTPVTERSELTDILTLDIGPSGLPLWDGREVTVRAQKEVALGGLSLRTTASAVIVYSDEVIVEYTIDGTLESANPGEVPLSLNGLGSSFYRATGENEITVMREMTLAHGDSNMVVTVDCNTVGVVTR